MSDYPQTSYEEQSTSSGDGITRMYWMNGEPRDKTPGRFWMDQERVANAGITEAPTGWKAINHTFRRGESADLYVAAGLRIAPIVWRQQNYYKDGSGGVEGWIADRKFGKLASNEGIAAEILCLVQGIDQPMVLRLNSTKASMAWMATILPAYKKMRDAVRKSRNGAPVPPWWFWLAVRSAVKAEEDGKATPVYEKVNGSVVTPPIWVAPEDTADREAWKALYVGNDLANQGEAIYLETGREWATKRIGDGYSAQPEPEGRNVPQPVSESDIPF
jgi:hypothetical protein